MEEAEGGRRRRAGGGGTGQWRGEGGRAGGGREGGEHAQRSVELMLANGALLMQHN